MLHINFYEELMPPFGEWVTNTHVNSPVSINEMTNKKIKKKNV